MRALDACIFILKIRGQLAGSDNLEGPNEGALAPKCTVAACALVIFAPKRRCMRGRCAMYSTVHAVHVQCKKMYSTVM